MKLLDKLRSQSGETLVEALASILVLTCAMMVLASGMSGAQKVASRITLEDTSFTLVGARDKEAVVMLESYEIGKQGHVTESGYYYYD